MKDAHLLIIGGLLVGAAFLAMQKPVETPKPKRTTAQKVGAVKKTGWTGAALAAKKLADLQHETGRRFKAGVYSARKGGPIGKLHRETAKKFQASVLDDVRNFRKGVTAMSELQRDTAQRFHDTVKETATGLLDSGVRAANTAYASARRTGHKTVRAVNRVQKKAEEVVTEKAQEVWDDPTWGF